MSQACKMNIEGITEDIFNLRGVMNRLTPLIRQSRVKGLQARKKVEQDKRTCLCNSPSFLMAKGGGRCVGVLEFSASGKQTCGLVV